MAFDLKAIERKFDAVCDFEDAKDAQIAASLAYSIDVPALIAEVKSLIERIAGADNQAYYYDEEISRLNHRVEELRNDLYDKDRRIRDLESELYETQRQAERQRQDANRGW